MRKSDAIVVLCVRVGGEGVGAISSEFSKVGNLVGVSATMNEVIKIEREVAAADRDREAKLAEIRDKLVRGMQGVAAQAVQP